MKARSGNLTSVETEMRVIFLDIDGVLNSERLLQDIDAQHRALDEHECFCYSLRRNMDRRCVARLNRIVRETGAKVVISSSWRLLLDPGEVAGVLTSFGFEGEVIGETPDLVNDAVWLAANRWGRENYERIERGHEIWEWIVRNPDVTHFVILDDCSDMARLKPWHVHVDFEVGLDDPDVERALHLMEKSAGAIATVTVRAFMDRAP